jgi:hypothetical protein
MHTPRQSRRRRRLFLTLSVAAGLALAVPTIAPAEDDVDAQPAAAEPEVCTSPDVASLAAVECVGAAAPDEGSQSEPTAALAVATLDAAFSRTFQTPANVALPAYCRIPAQVVLYTSSDWLRAGQKLIADASPCAEYYISIPPLAADKTRFRVLQDDLVRAVDGDENRIHPIAEIHTGGWQAWVALNKKSWYEAGVEARVRMADAGYGSLPGEIWAINEFSSAVRLGNGSARRNMLELMRGLHDGAPGMAPMRGIVFVIGLSQTVADTSVYRNTLRGWLQDAPFWTEIDRYVDFFAQEVYADVRNWGVEGSSRHERAEHLNDYLEHLAILAGAGPETAAAARTFMTRTYVPLANAAWPWDFGFGWTMVEPDVMAHFVATQTYAIRHFAGTNPHSFPGNRIGFAYAPNSRAGVTLPDLAVGTGLILDRLASGLHYAYNRGGSSPVGACGPPGEHVWCEANVAGALFNSAWRLLASWE